MTPDNLEGALERANRLLEEGKAAEALRLLDQFLDTHIADDEDRIEWSTLRAWALSEMDRGTEAIELLQPLLEEFPSSARLFGTLGVVLSNDDQLEDARDALETAVELDSEDEMLLANLALVCEKMRDYTRAIQLYDQAMDLGADIDWALNRKAAAQTEAGDYTAAKSTLRRYLSLVPDEAAPWISLAILHSDDNEFAQSYECYQTAENISPNSASLRLNWGVTAVRAGDLAIARKQLEELRRIEPESTRPAMLGAFIVEEEGKLSVARDIYEDVLRRVDSADYSELTYALEMAMDFFSRRGSRRRCQELILRAYRENACTVELCEAYREAIGDPVEGVRWYSIMVEANYRIGLSETYERGAGSEEPFTRLLRNFQVVARDRDDAAGLVAAFAREMGERDFVIREFVGEADVSPTPTGIYEVEREALVFGA